LNLIVFDVIQRADAEADMDFLAADLKVELCIETAEEKAKWNMDIIAMDVNDDIGRAKNAFGFVQSSQEFFEKAQLAEEFTAECVFAAAFAAFDRIFTGSVENRESH
jgi:hypothetical protein